MAGVRADTTAASCSSKARPAARISSSRARTAAWTGPSTDSTRTIELFCATSAAIMSAALTSPPRPVRSRRRSAPAMPKASDSAQM